VIEHDLLGDYEVRGDAYLRIHTRRAVEDFPIVSVKQAAAMAVGVSPAA
jgi:aspartate ammonia-lyase